MKKILILLLFTSFLFAQANRTTINTGVDKWHRALDHAYLNFADSAVTIAATRYVWYTVTGTNDSIWSEIELAGITSENDSLYLGKDGDYEGAATVYWIGGNNDVYQGQIKHNSTSLVKSYAKVSADTMGMHMCYYIEGGEEGDTVLVQIRNTKNSNDPILLGGTHKIFFVHD